eukprot:5916376-Amphidinium_carterae.1
MSSFLDGLPRLPSLRNNIGWDANVAKLPECQLWIGCNLSKKWGGSHVEGFYVIKGVVDGGGLLCTKVLCFGGGVSSYKGFVFKFTCKRTFCLKGVAGG